MRIFFLFTHFSVCYHTFCNVIFCLYFRLVVAIEIMKISVSLLWKSLNWGYYFLLSMYYLVSEGANSIKTSLVDISITSPYIYLSVLYIQLLLRQILASILVLFRQKCPFPGNVFQMWFFWNFRCDVHDLSFPGMWVIHAPLIF